MEILHLKVVQVPNAGPAASRQRDRHISSQHQGRDKSNTANSYQNRYSNRLRQTMLADNDKKKTLIAHVEEKIKQAPFEKLAIV